MILYASKRIQDTGEIPRVGHRLKKKTRRERDREKLKERREVFGNKMSFW